MMLCELYDQIGKLMREQPELQTSNVTIETCCDSVPLTYVSVEKLWEDRPSWVVLEGR